MRSSWLVPVVLLVGCNLVKTKKEDVAPTQASALAAPVASASATSTKPPPVPAPTEPLALDLDGKKVPLPNGIATLSNGRLVITLANQAQSCDDFGSKAGPDEKRMSLELHVPAGPGGTFFAGHRVGVTGDVQGVPGTYVNANQLVVQLDSAGAKPGTHVKGWAMWTRGKNSAKGTFDATVCAPLAPETPPELGTEATGSVAGEVAGEKFETKKALAIVKHDKVLDGDYVSEIDFFGRDDVTCDDTPATDTKTPSLAIVDLGGASTKNDLTGTVQPTHGMFATKAWKVGKPRTTGDGWIKLDSLDFDAPLKGTFRFVTPKGGAGGAFTADVCRKLDAPK